MRPARSGAPRAAHSQATNKTTPAGQPLGVAVVETGDSKYMESVARAHAAVLSDFVARGHAAAMEAHPAPKQQP